VSIVHSEQDSGKHTPRVGSFASFESLVRRHFDRMGCMKEGVPRAGLVAGTSAKQDLLRAKVGPDSPHNARTTATPQDRWLVIREGGHCETRMLPE
jgi:hypothetical protein